MARATIGITIARPIEDVFAVLTDVEKTGLWYPADVEEHWTTPPPHGVGSRRHAVIRVMGRTIENDGTATEYDPPRRAALRIESQGMTASVGLDFVEAGGGNATAVTVTTDFAADGARRLLIGLFAGVYRRQWRQGLANLKRMMESGEL